MTISSTHPSTTAEAALAPRVYCVAGMHRSGTSLVASLLQKAGVHMGSRLLEARDDNPRGYFEDVDFQQFHEGCLDRRRATYMEPPGPSILLSDPEISEARRLIEERRALTAWGWKDPRTCLFLESWRQLLGERARFIVVYRHPVEVLASLIRRGEWIAISDSAATLNAWATYNQGILQFLDRHAPQAVVLETAAMIEQPQQACPLFQELGVGLTWQIIAETAHRSEYATMPAAELLMPLVRRLSDAVAPVLEQLERRAAMRCRRAGSAPALGLEQIVRVAEGAGDDRRVLHNLLLAAMSVADPRIAAGAAKGYALIGSAARSNYERALSAERASEENYQRALAAETASETNYRRALYAEAASKGNYERALSAEAASKGNYERALSAEQAAAGAHEAMRAAAARADSLAAQVDQINGLLLTERHRRGEQEQQLLRARQELAAAGELAHRLEFERNYYRRRWPPYALRWAAGRVLDRYRQHAMRRHPAVARFGQSARIAILWTGVPQASVQAAMDRQSRDIAQVVMPGACEVARSPRVQHVRVHNWWAPDLPGLMADADYVLLMHPQYYGAGPLWSGTNVEMLCAALAADASVNAVVLRGRAGSPRIEGINHTHETDEATLRQWDDTSLALFARARPLCEAFARANPGESRDLRETAAQLMRTGRVLIAPQSFPIDPAQAASATAETGSRLPAEPKAPIRALYVTQWIECGGADKGILDLLTRIDPQVVDFSLMTTVASEHRWDHRVRPHVRELLHLGAFLPLPPEQRFPQFLVEYCRRRQIGLVHIMHSFLGYDALPQLKRELPQVRTVDQCHILEPPDNMEGGHPAYSSRRYKQYLDHRVVTSQWLKRYLMREHGIADQRISVIYTCVDWQEEFNPDRFSRGRFRAKLGIRESSLVVLFVGRLHWQKRPHLFMRIAEQVQKRRPELDAVFVMLGSGDQQQRLEEMRLALPDPRRVILAGESSQPGPAYRDADLLLMTSGHEGLAYVSFEAMAMGLPQIFTDVNAQSELITPQTGVLLPADEASVVERGTQAVIELLEDAPRRQAMAQAARQRVQQHFGLGDMVRQYEQLYQRLCAR